MSLVFISSSLTSDQARRYLQPIVTFHRLITLTTDFGVSEPYVGIMKGVIHRINPSAEIVDISHRVESFDILDGALSISQAYSYFPQDAIHLVVVDPGVGSARRPILVRAGAYYFVCPDNGVLSLVYEREKDVWVRHVTAKRYFLSPVSDTFHGRDIFAPVAAYLSRGEEDAHFGDPITDYVKFAVPRPRPLAPNVWRAEVLKMDKFGNLITNITPQALPQLFDGSSPAFKIIVGKAQVTRLYSNYAAGEEGELFAILGSAGFLEVSANQNSASRLAAAGKGSELTITLESSS